MTGPHDAPQDPTWATPGSAPGPRPGQQPGQRPGQGGPAPVAPQASPPASPSAPQAPSLPGEAPGTASGGAPPAAPAPAPVPPTGWAAAPGWGTPPVPPSAPPSMPPAPGAPTGPMPGYGYAPAAWRPPALQPGIIPLRPLNLGEILDGSFRAVRANPTVMFGLSLLVITVMVALQAVLVWYIGGLVTGEVATWLDEMAGPGLDPATTADTVDMLGSYVATVLTAPLIAVATTILTGLLIVSVSRSVLGRKVSVGEVLRSRQVWAVIGFTLLQAVAVLLAGALVLVPVVWLVVSESFVAASLIGLVGALVLVVGSFWFLVRTLLVPAALMLEGGAFWRTVARAWRLTRGSYWRLLGIWLLTQIIVGFVAYIIQLPVSLVVAVVFQETVPTSFGAIAATSVGQILGYTISTTFSAAVVALLYIDTRMRREGLDIELARAAQQPA
jgi:hypothetical protein